MDYELKGKGKKWNGNKNGNKIPPPTALTTVYHLVGPIHYPSFQRATTIANNNSKKHIKWTKWCTDWSLRWSIIAQKKNFNSIGMINWTYELKKKKKIIHRNQWLVWNKKIYFFHSKHQHGLFWNITIIIIIIVKIMVVVHSRYESEWSIIDWLIIEDWFAIIVFATNQSFQMIDRIQEMQLEIWTL